MRICIVSAVAILITLASCSKVKFEQSEYDDLGPDILNVVESKSVSSMKEAYLLLPNSEKELLWRTKLRHIEKNSDGLLDPESIKIIQGMLALISRHGMNNLFRQPELGQAFVIENLNMLEKKFSKDQLFLLIELPYYSRDFSLVHATEILNGLNWSTGIEDKKAIRSMDAELPKCKCIYDIACPGYGNNCDTNAQCSITTDGCGIFGTSQCKGLCEVFP